MSSNRSYRSYERDPSSDLYRSDRDWRNRRGDQWRNRRWDGRRGNNYWGWNNWWGSNWWNPFDWFYYTPRQYPVLYTTEFADDSSMVVMQPNSGYGFRNFILCILAIIIICFIIYMIRNN